MWGARYWLARVFGSRFWSAVGAAGGPVALPAESDFSTESTTDLDGESLAQSSHSWATSHGSGWKVTSVEAAPISTLSGVVVTDMPDTADIDVQATISVVSRNGLIARWVSDGNYYYGGVDPSGNGVIYKYTGGSRSTLATGSAIATGSVVKFRVYTSGSDAVLEVFDDGVSSVSHTDTSSPWGAGKAGMTVLASTSARWDDFSAAVYTPTPSGRTTKNSRQWGMNTMPGTRLQMIVGGR